jgi:hypothetical protein
VNNRTWDKWHGLTIHEEGWSLDHQGGCPTYPDGPGEDDVAYSCPTYSVLSYWKTGFGEMNSLKPGTYRIRYWSETSPIDGEFDEGFDVERAE